MNRTTQSRTTPRGCCAPIERAFCKPAAFAYPSAIAICITLGLSARLVADDVPQTVVANSDAYLETGFPNPTRIPGPFTGAVDLNPFLGATRFYNAGFTGSRAVMANIEAGYIWNGHETLTHVGLIPTSPGALGEYDRHATAVAMLMGGRLGGTEPGEYQLGIAPGAQFFSGAISQGWVGTRFTASFNYDPSSMSTWGPYRAAFETGLSTSGGTRTADVVNSSWVGGGGITGNDQLAGTLDALANTNTRTLFVVAAGNAGPGPNTIISPASGYNNLTVGSLTSNGSQYNIPSSFTSGGPNDYQDPTRYIPQVRQVVDIAAPGENVSTAYYGGETGGNSPSLGGLPSGPPGGPNYYTHSTAGTSFSTPMVTGGIALLYDAAYAVFPTDADARDARVMKAVIMNSADKTLGWNNGQAANPNGLGGVVTSKGLDNLVGAGRMNLSRAFDQFLSGTTDVVGTLPGPMGLVNPVGWDFGNVAQGLTNDYLINTPLEAGSNFTATLTWFRDRLEFGTTNFSDASYDNLDLELWSDTAGIPTNLISASNSLYNNSEHFSFKIPATGQYSVRVRWTGELFDNVGDLNAEQYGLAWSGTSAVPEPSFILLLVGLVPWSLKRRASAAK